MAGEISFLVLCSRRDGAGVMEMMECDDPRLHFLIALVDRRLKG